MIITIASFKGGVGKTTTAVHLAGYLSQKCGPTLLIDGDANRSATAWANRGALNFLDNGSTAESAIAAGAFGFRVVDERQGPKYARDSHYEHIVIDTEAGLALEDLRALALGCDRLIIPTTPDALALDALMITVKALQSIESLTADQYKVLLTIIPPLPNHYGDEAANILRQSNIPLFSTGIRRFMAFQKAALSGVLVHAAKDARAGEAWNDYVSIGDELFK